MELYAIPRGKLEVIFQTLFSESQTAYLRGSGQMVANSKQKTKVNENQKSVNAYIDKTLYNDLHKAYNGHFKPTFGIREGLKLLLESKQGEVATAEKTHNEIAALDYRIKELERCFKHIQLEHLLSKESPENAKEESNLIFNELIDNYSSIAFSKSIIAFKEKQLSNFAEQIKCLKNKKRIKNIPHEESFDLCVSILEKLERGDKVIAVSCFGLGGWPKEKCWESYLEAQKKAADQGATVERIFYHTDKKFPFETIPITQIHEKKLIGYIMESETEVSNYIPSDLKEIFNDGFMLINSTDDRIALHDHFENLNYRTDIITDEEELTKIEGVFNTIKKMLRPLSIGPS